MAEQGTKKRQNASKKRVPYSAIKHQYRGRRFSIAIHGAKPENCPILELLTKQFQSKDMYTVVAVAYQTGKHGVHPHWQIYLQVQPRVENMKSIISSVLEPLGIEQNFHIEACIGTKSSNLNYVYAVRKQHELGWVQYAKGHAVPLGYEPTKTNNLLWLRDNMKPWQKQVYDKVTKQSVNFRDILWVWEPEGNTGKTYLSKYLHYFHGAIVVGGSAADMKHAIARWRQITGTFPVIIIIDIARSDMFTSTSYKGLQQIKNGLFFSGKYESGMVASLQPPHLVVFSNAKPQTKFMSKDRWIVKYIDPQTQTLIDCIQDS